MVAKKQVGLIEKPDHDVLIERPDLGPGVCTLIKAGDTIPDNLAGFERRPAPEA